MMLMYGVVSHLSVSRFSIRIRFPFRQFSFNPFPFRPCRVWITQHHHDVPRPTRRVLEGRMRRVTVDGGGRGRRRRAQSQQ